jgi:dienelactone hydrolase
VQPRQMNRPKQIGNPHSRPVACAIQIARSILPRHAEKLRPFTIKDKTMRHALPIVMMLISTAASAEMVKIPWKGDYKHNSIKTWAREDPYDSGFAKNFNNGTPEERGRVEKDGKLWAEIMVPANITGPIPFMLILHGCTGLDFVSNEWAHKVAKELNAEGIGALILDSFTTRFMAKTCGMPDFHWGRRRADDAYSALDYLIEQKLAKPDEVYLMGQSNGGLTTLIAMSKEESDHANKFAAGFPVVPSCINTPVKYGDYLRPMIVFAGEQDDANPAKYCIEMLKKKRAIPMRLIVYKAANHGYMFDYRGKEYVIKGWTDSHGDVHMWHLSSNSTASQDMMTTIVAAIKTKNIVTGVEFR